MVSVVHSNTKNLQWHGNGCFNVTYIYSLGSSSLSYNESGFESTLSIPVTGAASWISDGWNCETSRLSEQSLVIFDCFKQFCSIELSILSPVIFYLERRWTWCNILGSCSQSTVTPLQFMMKRFMMFTMFMMTMTTCMRARTEGAMWERSTTEPPSPSSAPGTWSALEVRLGTHSLSPLLILMGLWCVRIPTEDFTDVAQCVGTIVHQLCLWC